MIGFGDDGAVFLVVRILGPAVKNEMIVGDFAGFVSNADRAGVAHPSTIGWDTKKSHGIEIRAGLFQDSSDARFSHAVFDEQIDAFDLG